MITKDQMIDMIKRNIANLKNSETHKKEGQYTTLNRFGVQTESGFKKLTGFKVSANLWQHEDWIGTERARLYINDENGNKMFYIEATKEGDYIFVM